MPEQKSEDTKEDVEKRDKKTDRPQSLWFKDVIEIFPNEPLPYLDRGPVKAFAAKGKKGERLYALVCTDKGLVPRIEDVSKFTGLQTPFIGLLKASGIIYWPDHGTEAYIFVYENIYNARVLEAGKPLALGVKDDIIKSVVFPSILSVLEDVRYYDFVHGSICAENLYFLSGSTSSQTITSSDKIGMGECLSLPFGYAQHPTYLTAERCLSHPAGAGTGVAADDMYALGATLAVLMRNNDPLKGMSRKEIAQAKLELGSFTALVGKNRIIGSMLELMRGLLNDDPYQRWDIEDLITWRDGQRVGVKQPGVKRYKAKRPITLVETKYLRPEILATDMQENVTASEGLIENGELLQWMERAIGDKPFIHKVQQAIDTGSGIHNPSSKALKIALVSGALGNAMPLIVNETSFLSEGFGKMMVYDYVHGKDTSFYIDVINSQVLMYWIDNFTVGGLDYGGLATKLGNCHSSLKQQGLGYGFERCFYILSGDAPCLSETYKDYYMRSPEDFFWALDDLCLKGKVPRYPIDRHVAAFMSVRDRQMIDAYLIDLNSSDEKIKSLALLKTLATLQFRSKLPPAKGLSSWVADTLGQSLVKSFHDRERRKEVLAKLQKLKTAGNMVKVAELFDNNSSLKKDHREYLGAIQEYQNLEKEFSFTEKIVAKPDGYGAGGGRQMAALLSALIGGLIIAGTLATSLG
ncbi:MAG: hypothetical protein CL565_01170 [Alphaproteobacteria bacterium]|nr:hypothetical protein [Alphaproteobacteria bacterium]